MGALLNKLQGAHDRAAQIVTDITDRGKELLQKLSWLNIQQQIEFDTAVVVQSQLDHNVAQSCLAEHSAKTSIHSISIGLDLLTMPLPTSFKLEIWVREFFCEGYKVHNKLKSDAREIESIHSFHKT